MNKKIWLLCFLVVVAIFCSVVIRFVGQPKYQDVIDAGKIVYYEDADTVIDDSVLIVRVKKTREVPSSRFYELGIPMENTLSVVEIEEVLQRGGYFSLNRK